MTSLERVFTTLGQKEPDRVPLFLLVTMHGAKELGLSLSSYFSKAENVAEGQLRMRAKYEHDCLYSIFYAPLEIEAFGGEVIFSDNGPANSGEPFIKNKEQIRHLAAPKVKDSKCLQKVLRCIEILKEKKGDEAPILGVVMSPFSLPVMQMGFDRYIELMYNEPDLFNSLMRIIEEFAVDWANAQLKAGATAIGYFDPVSSTTVVPREKFLETGYEIAKRTIARIKGPCAIHMASGRCLPIIDDIANIGAPIIGTSVLEDLSDVKVACRQRLTILGNLNGIEMCRWTPEETETKVKEAIAKAGPGGGFILSDNHGEIPFQVPEEVLFAISDSVKKWGNYPINITDL